MCRSTVRLVLVCALWLAAPSAWADKRMPPVDTYPSDLAAVWFDTLYDVIKVEATAPPPAARIYGVAAVALYEAVVPGALHHRSLVGQLNGLASVPQRKKHGNYHWPTVANAALARTIRGLFPSLKPAHLTAINALEQSFATQFQAEVKRKDYKRHCQVNCCVKKTLPLGGFFIRFRGADVPLNHPILCREPLT